MKIEVKHIKEYDESEYDNLDEILDDYWSDIKKGDELITTIQKRYKEELLKIIDKDKLVNV